MTSHDQSIQLEVERGERFEFGSNWQRFLQRLTPERMRLAESSLQQMLECDDLRGKTFLDVGCGSGLFSLAAHRLGAKVFSFDYDPRSVACAEQLRARFCEDPGSWHIECGSALDRAYLDRLGVFDIVYSWGVLHHTGSMWEALGNVGNLTRAGGRLFIALYNDQGRKSRIWWHVKRAYNHTPSWLRFLIVWPWGLCVLAGMTVRDLLHLRKPRLLSAEYDGRGMSAWTDVVDWVGGYPFEVATPDQVIAFFQNRQYQLAKLVTCGNKLGCNEYVFVKLG